MKKGFTTFLSALKANTPPCKKGLSSHRFLSLFLILFLAVGNAWAQTEIFRFTATSSTTAKGTYSATGGTAEVKGSAFSTGGSNEITVGSQIFYKFSSSTEVEFTLTSGTFAVGDVISFTCACTTSNKTGKGVAIQTSPVITVKGDFPKNESNTISYTVAENDGVAGKSSFSIKRNDSDIKFGTVSVTRADAGGDPVCPGTLTITSKNDKTAFYTGDAIELTAALSEGNGAITYQWYKGGKAEGNKLTGKTAAKLEIASCAVSDAGDYYCVASKADCSDAVNTDAFTITVTPSPCVTVTGAEQFVADYTINGAYAINSGCATNNGALKIDNGADFVEIYAPAGKKISLIEMSLYAGADKKVGYGFGASAVVDNDLMPWDWATKDVTGSYADYEFEPISSGKAKYFRLYRKVNVDAVDYGSGTSTFINRICVTLENTVAYAITYNLNGGTGTTPMESNKEAGTVVTLASGTSGITPPTDKKFNGWLVKDATDATVTVTDGKFTMPTSEVTITAQWADVFAVTYAKGDEGASGEMTDSNSPYVAGAEVTLLANAFTPPTGKEFDAWEVTETESGDPVAVSENKFTMPAAAVTVKATWKDACALDPTVSATTLGTTSYTTQVVNCAGISVLGSAGCTISEYGFVYGTATAPTISDNKKALEGDYTVAGTAFAETTLSGLASNTTYYVRAFATNSHGTAYGDEISFTTLAPLGNVLVVANSASQTSDAITALSDNGFIVTVSAPNNSRDYTGYDLVVLDESLSGGNGVDGKEEGDIKGANIPILNLKAFFYTKTNRWNWGAPVNGTAMNEIANISAAYCNAEAHPIFTGLTIGAGGAIDLIDPAVASGNTLQGVTTNTLVEGKEGYTLATSGDGITFIHELTPAQRGVTDAKYLMVAISNNAKDNLSADGEKLIVNAAKYLIGSTSWTPVLVPTTPEIVGTTAYSAGETIELTASATGESATTTYTWYKGATLEAAKEAGAIKTAKTIAENGNVYSKAECVVGDAGIYWCVISNGTDCEANVSVEITVSDASYNASFVSAYGTAPVATSGVSYTLPELTESGYVHQGWTANIDVTVDEAVVTAGTTIANGKTAIFGADVTFTAVWKQIFEVTFNMSGYGDAIDPQTIADGGKVTKPADPVVIGQEFGGWYKESTCENAWDFENDVVSTATELFAKWTEFEGCVLLVPETSGDALHVGDNVSVQSGSKGATIAIVGMKTDGSSIAYSTNGLSLNGGGADVISVTLNNDMAVGTKISVTLIAANTGSRGVNLLNSTGGSVAGGTKLGWDDATTGAEATFSYTVTASDGLDGTNIFRLQRNNSVYLKCLKVESCGAAITYHNLTSEVVPAGIMGTVTLGASSVREGYTTTATYSEIDPLYEFVKWTVSGEGASVADATANPATITVGTEDAVVTLNLRLIPVKFTVEYYDGATAMGTEQVAVNENPTASDILTAKRGYVFEGWATSSTATASDVIALNTITSDVTTTINLYAVYTEIPCPTEGTVFSMNITDPAGTEYNGNNEFNLEIGATYVGGKAYSGSKNSTNRKGAIDENGEYSFAAAGDVTVKVAMDCALQEGDVITFTTSTTRELKIQKVAGTDLVTTSGKKYVIPAESPLIGVYDFYLERGNSQSTMKTFNVTRPYTVSFDMQGHGDAIEAQKLIAGDKVVEPAAPTADGWDFKGWYKESACTNAWDFENDVVAGTMALYAKWDVHVTNDATLKSLKYGSEAIALEDGVFEYNIGLPALTASVPALTAVANSATVHSLDIVDAAAFDVDGNAISTVTVVSEDETVTNVYTVNFSKLAELPLADVTGSTTWNFANAVTANVSITGTPQVLANYAGVTNDNTFESDKLEASGEKFTAGSKANLRANYIHFHTTVPGMLTISYSNTGGNSARYIYVNGAKYDEDGSANTTPKGADNKVFVPAGDVELVMMDGGDASKNVQIYQMIFNATPDYTRDVTEGRYGTICLPNGGVMVGASLFELSYYNETQGLLYMDEADATMVAGNPYIFLPSDGVEQIKVYYTDETTAAAKTVNGLVGYLGNEDMQLEGDGTNYILKDNKIKKVVGGNNSNVFVTKNRAYIQLGNVNPNEPAPVPGRRRVAIGQAPQVATGMENVDASAQPVKMIINGQLFILRGEKMYDAQGKLVK